MGDKSIILLQALYDKLLLNDNVHRVMPIEESVVSLWYHSYYDTRDCMGKLTYNVYFNLHVQDSIFVSTLVCELKEVI